MLYGTESGNSESLADKTVKAGEKEGLQSGDENLADISVKDIVKFQNVGLIVSTWGDGEPPEAVEAFHKEFMSAKRGPQRGEIFRLCSWRYFI